jgi:predicted O-methyltransferase YrrM
MDNNNLNEINKIINSTRDDNLIVNTLNLKGMSGKKLIYTLHSLTKLLCGDNVIYLEIGVFRGLTLISNSYYNQNVLCYGIDNFSLFDQDKQNISIINENVNKFNLLNTMIINLDYEVALDALNNYIGDNKVGVFFVDGAHDYRSQLVPLLRIIPYLAENAVVIIDDANYPHVRQATNDFLKSNHDFALLFEAYTTKHPSNMNKNEEFESLDGWWNGVNILIKDQKNLIKRNFVKEDMKHLYFNSHDIFRHEFADIAFELIKLVQENKTIEIEELVKNHRLKNKNLFKHQNTYSSELTKYNLITE